MDVRLRCGRDDVTLAVPEGAVVYGSAFGEPGGSSADLVMKSVRSPVGSLPLAEALAGRRGGPVVVVVSDITRPIPYASFLGDLLAEIESAGVQRDGIEILVATGMHRPSTSDERVEMFGDVAGRYRVTDHVADDEDTLAELGGESASGARVKLNRRFVEAGFRMVTGLVEPHFMAGFSGGRKAVCPGLASLETVRNFHGYEFLANPFARNGRLEGNPLHEEAVSVARLVGVDFCVNVVLDSDRRVVRSFAGELEASHLAACDFVRGAACPPVEREADAVLTSCGGYPLDATFYQCVKGLVGCLPAVRAGGTVIAVAGCSEGVGSPEYAEILRRYSGRWREFLADISRPGVFTRDQWEFQMHCRAIEKVGVGNILFVTDGLDAEKLSRLSVTGRAAEPGGVELAAQGLLDSVLRPGSTFAVIPEGPYVTPMA